MKLVPVCFPLVIGKSDETFSLCLNIFTIKFADRTDILQFNIRKTRIVNSSLGKKETTRNKITSIDKNKSDLVELVYTAEGVKQMVHQI